MSELFIGLDLGQTNDYTAMVAVEVVPVEVGKLPQHHIRHISRFELGTPYPVIVDQVQQMVVNLAFQRKHLIVDSTGVGAPVVDLLRQAETNPIPVIITSGQEPGMTNGTWKVPKRDLVGILSVLFTTGRLRIAQGLPEVQNFVDELMAFQVKVSTAGRDTYGAWREGSHDDLVLAAALACWYAEKALGRPVRDVVMDRMNKKKAPSIWKWGE